MDWRRLSRKLLGYAAGTVAIAGLALWNVSPAASQPSDRPSLAPLNPAFEQHLRGLTIGGLGPQSQQEPVRGLVPPPLDLSHNRGKRISTLSYATNGFPAFFDLRAQVPARLSPVRNQGGCGSCWAFATYGSMESCLLPAQAYDFSENHLKNTHGFDWTCCEGGNHWISTAYLARWSGPALESDDPYNPSSCVSPTSVPVCKHVQRVDFIPDRAGPLDNDNIKQAVMNYGAVHTAYYHSNTYYNGATYSYYYSGGQLANHAVCIVGWDDDYDKSRFLTTPPGNGAFIVRNSWGSGWGQGGYFYVSYYDSLIGTENAVFHNAEPADNYNQIYQYDPYGWVSSVGYGTDTAWFANVFTAATDTQIAAAGLYTASLQSTYELRVYLDPDSGPIASGGPVSVAMGTIQNPGYQTIVLGSPVFVESGRRFSVVVRLTTPDYNYPIPIEQPLTGYSSAASARRGESYISSNGSVWSDLTDSYAGSNVCLKAYATCAGGIGVEPVSELASVGPEGGPFSPASRVYTVTNYGAETVEWTAAASEPWIDLSSTGGALPGGASAQVVIAVNSTAASLQPGFYEGTVMFTNTTDHRGDTVRRVTLTVFGSYEVKTTSFRWIDPTSHTRLYLSDDGVSAAQPMPFAFSLYDKPYTQLYVGANGLLGFVSLNLNSYFNTSLPTTNAPNAALYVYWDDLDPGAAGQVYIGTEGTAPNRKVVVSWVGVRRYGAPSTRLTFQAVLCEGSNDIIFNYLDVKPEDMTYGAGRSATVGIENETGTAAVQYSYNGSVLLANRRAILFTSRGPSPLEAKLLPDNAAVAIRRAVVTKAFDDFFYIESDDRLCGIRVNSPGHEVSAGLRVDVSGLLKTNPDGERYIEAAYVSQTGTGSVAPVGVGSGCIGGGPLSYDPQTGAGQQGMKAWHKVKQPDGGWRWEAFDLPGPNNVGLLVEAWGRVSWVGDGVFYVDDGRGLRDTTDHAGVRVWAPGVDPPEVGAFVRLVGVVSCYKVDDSVCRMIRLADESDMAVVR